MTMSNGKRKKLIEAVLNGVKGVAKAVGQAQQGDKKKAVEQKKPCGGCD